MAIVTTSVTLSDTALETVFRDTFTDNVTAKVIATSVRVVPKSGSPAFNQNDLETKARAALTANATYLAIASPTVAQNTAQTKALTRQVNALIKFALGDFTDVSGT